MLSGLLAIILYLLASTLLTVKLVRGRQPDCQHNQTRMIALAAVVIHANLLYATLLTPEGLNLGILHAASLVAMTTSLLLVLSMFVEPVENLGIAVFPVAAPMAPPIIAPEPAPMATPLSVVLIPAHPKPPSTNTPSNTGTRPMPVSR